MLEHGLCWPLGVVLATNSTRQAGFSDVGLHSRPEKAFSLSPYAAVIALIGFVYLAKHLRSQRGGYYNLIQFEKETVVSCDLLSVTPESPNSSGTDFLSSGQPVIITEFRMDRPGSLLVSVRILSNVSAVALLGFRSISTNSTRKTSDCCDSKESLSAARDNVSATCSSFPF